MGKIIQFRKKKTVRKLPKIPHLLILSGILFLHLMAWVALIFVIKEFIQ